MAWQWTKVTELPLGKRILHDGDQGSDVQTLQQLLKQTGFYFGNCDGIFGVLTEEAVVLFQKTFHLRIDGRVGREVVKALRDSSQRVGRLIYTVKEAENLSTISQKFQVRNSAWDSIAGQGKPQHKIYPGMKLVLNEKAVLVWEETRRNSNPGPALETVSGQIRAALHCGADLKLILPETVDPGFFHLVAAEPAVWNDLLAAKKEWRGWCSQLSGYPNLKWGVDLRNAPLEAVFRWVEFLKYVGSNAKPCELAVLPLFPADRAGFSDRLYWLNLPLIAKTVKWLVFEPVLGTDSPELFRESVVQSRKLLRELLRLGLAGRSLWLGELAAWDWNLDRASLAKISYREARLIRAMSPRSCRTWPELGYTRVDFSRRRERHCLIYRDETDWAVFLKSAVQYQLFGVVLRNFGAMGSAGAELLAATFAVLPPAKLN